MTEADMIDIIRGATGLHASDARVALHGLFRSIADEIALNPNGVHLPELGSMRRVARPEKPGRHPRTGEAIQIPARYATTFAASRPLRRRLAELAPPVFKAAAE